MDLARKLPERPDPEAIHDLRVAARRVQAMVRVLPKGVRRSKRAREFRAAVGSLLKSTSQIRDMDTLTETLQVERTSLPGELLRSLENERSDLAATSRPVVMAFMRVRTPLLDSSQINPKKLARRLRKEVDEELQMVSTLLPEVTGSESKIKELHTLRKEVKKLRYVMELAEGTASELRNLTEWQEALGAAHDIDVAIEYLRASGWKVPESALADLGRKRHSMYIRFLGIALRSSTKVIPESMVSSARTAR